MNKNKLILPISIVLGCLIFGGFFYLVQTNNQKLKAEEEKSLIKFNKKTECMNICKEYYEKEVSSNSGLNIFNPTYAYNEELDACFYSGGIFDSSLLEYRIIDCQTNQTMMTFTTHNKDVICASNACAYSKDEFKEKEKELLKNY